MFVAMLMADLELEVWDRLSAVTDPELDEPITEMGFVERVGISDGKAVQVEFRLPTYWCSPNFAFLMAFGIRSQILSLPWVQSARVQLNDHCFGERVNQGVNSGRAYHEVFAEYCDGARLDEVEAKFAAKAFDRRQEAVLLGVQATGRSARQIVGMTLGALTALRLTGAEAVRQLPRYLDILRAQGLAVAPDDPAFPTWEGGPIPPDALAGHLARLRSTRINMEFNGALCRGLAQTRYKQVEIGPDGPTLVDFITGRMPPPDGATTVRN